MDAATCWKLLAAMGAALTVVCGVVSKLYADLREAREELKRCQDARVAQAEEHYRELATLRNMVKSKKGGQP